MKISKKDALNWFRFFAELPEGEELMTKQQEIVDATFAQIERAIDDRNETLCKIVPKQVKIPVSYPFVCCSYET